MSKKNKVQKPKASAKRKQENPGEEPVEIPQKGWCERCYLFWRDHLKEEFPDKDEMTFRKKREKAVSDKINKALSNATVTYAKRGIKDAMDLNHTAHNLDGTVTIMDTLTEPELRAELGVDRLPVDAKIPATIGTAYNAVTNEHQKIFYFPNVYFPYRISFVGSMSSVNQKWPWDNKNHENLMYDGEASNKRAAMTKDHCHGATVNFKMVGLEEYVRDFQEKKAQGKLDADNNDLESQTMNVDDAGEDIGVADDDDKKEKQRALMTEGLKKKRRKKGAFIPDAAFKTPDGKAEAGLSPGSGGQNPIYGGSQIPKVFDKNSNVGINTAAGSNIDPGLAKVQSGSASPQPAQPLELLEATKKVDNTIGNMSCTLAMKDKAKPGRTSGPARKLGEEYEAVPLTQFVGKKLTDHCILFDGAVELQLVLTMDYDRKQVLLKMMEDNGIIFPTERQLDTSERHARDLAKSGGLMSLEYMKCLSPFSLKDLKLAVKGWVPRDPHIWLTVSSDDDKCAVWDRVVLQEVLCSYVKLGKEGASQVMVLVRNIITFFDNHIVIVGQSNLISDCRKRTVHFCNILEGVLKETCDKFEFQQQVLEFNKLCLNVIAVKAGTEPIHALADTVNGCAYYGQLVTTFVDQYDWFSLNEQTLDTTELFLLNGLTQTMKDWPQLEAAFEVVSTGMQKIGEDAMKPYSESLKEAAKHHYDNYLQSAKPTLQDADLTTAKNLYNKISTLYALDTDLASCYQELNSTMLEQGHETQGKDLVKMCERLGHLPTTDEIAEFEAGCKKLAGYMIPEDQTETRKTVESTIDDMFNFVRNNLGSDIAGQYVGVIYNIEDFFPKSEQTWSAYAAVLDSLAETYNIFMKYEDAGQN